MEYHFVQMKPTNTYLSLVDPNKKSRLICFQSKNTAKSVVDYVTNFRSEHGYWPVLDLSRPNTFVKSKPNVKKRTPEELKKYIGLETINYEDIEKMARKTNNSFMCVLRFSCTETDTEKQVIRFAGQEWDGRVDEASYRDLLEFNLKIT